MRTLNREHMPTGSRGGYLPSNLRRSHHGIYPQSCGDMVSNVDALAMVLLPSSHQHGPPLLGRVRVLADAPRLGEWSPGLRGTGILR